ncbi:MAG: polysaccharide biosynthesis/export family protein [Flavobacteriaceae bacterium]
MSFLSSCVPNKNLIYLQGEPFAKKEIHKINDAPYKLQVGDNIVIDVRSDNEELIKIFTSGGGIQAAGVIVYNIDRHGNNRMPRFGEINVLGYTTKEVRLKVEEEISKYLTEDVAYFVSVALNGIKYTIIGEIGSPGPKVVLENQLSIIDAICYVIRQNYSEKGMMKMIDSKSINEEVTNISYIFNDFSIKSKYGYGYGYGYGKYGNGYHKNEEPETLLGRIISFIKPKR